MMKYTFPEDFFFGSATSALQIEGAAFEDGKGLTSFDVWFSKEPERFFGGEGNLVGVDFYHRYPEYIEIMPQIGHNSFRFSIAWTRLFPDVYGEINQKAVDYYNDVIDRLLQKGIEPFVCLFHFDMPAQMQEIGGFESREVLACYAKYAQVCFRLFGDRVKYWFTFNEPIVPIEGSYLYGFHYPQILDFKRGIQAAYYTSVASAMAIAKMKELKEAGEVSQACEIGVILSMSPAYPKDPDSLADQQAAALCELFFNKSFLDPAVKGEFPQALIHVLKAYDLLPTTTPEERKLIRENTIDFLGFNYYFPRRVQAKKGATPQHITRPEDLYDTFDNPHKEFNPDRGWEIFPRGIYDMLIQLRDDYGNIKVYISENGMGRHRGDDDDRDEAGEIHDQVRIDFIRRHLIEIARARSEGSRVCGYHMWSLMDNWSMSNAYKNRYGFIYVDRENDMQLTCKKSAFWFHQLAQTREISDTDGSV